MALIKNFREEQAARVLSSETRNTLHQWHRRRTSERVNPCIEDFQVPPRRRRPRDGTEKGNRHRKPSFVSYV